VLSVFVHGVFVLSPFCMYTNLLKTDSGYPKDKVSLRVLGDLSLFLCVNDEAKYYSRQNAKTGVSRVFLICF